MASSWHPLSHLAVSHLLDGVDFLSHFSHKKSQQKEPILKSKNYLDLYINQYIYRAIPYVYYIYILIYI